ncbi:MAG: SufD family Fe-S cluster assembly protein [Sulfurovum sp.]|nr:SufD family Fe-S cluster assembly protein [Sulfurovum sp.]MDD3602366.1 SufD family Fe-S cluster assembly protein [Sulfurovum sp.]
MKLTALQDKNVDELRMLLGVDAKKDLLLKKLSELGMPEIKNEIYRYFDTQSLLEKQYDRIRFVPKKIEESDKIEIVDGIIKTAPKGIRVYYGEYKEVDTAHFDPLYYLGHLLVSSVIIIELDGDVETEILHRFTQPDTLIAYRLVIKNQANRHATVYETFEGAHAEGSLVLYGYDMHIAKDSSLRFLKNQTMHNREYSMIASHKISVQKQANMVYKSFDFGDASALTLLKAELDRFAHIEAGHLLYIAGHAKRGIVSQIIHKDEHTTSHQEAKNILDDNARGIFDALVKVEPSAKYTKAYQNSKSILLAENTYMIAKPQLEIYVDELEASHGATMGQLDKRQLFYLQSRGISQTDARKMLVMAFANTLIEKIKDARHQERIKTSFEAAFHASNKAEEHLPTLLR